MGRLETKGRLGREKKGDWEGDSKKVRTKRFLITDSQGWTTIVRKQVLSPTLKPGYWYSHVSAASRFPSSTPKGKRPSKLSSLLSRPTPTFHFRPAHGLPVGGHLNTAPSSTEKLVKPSPKPRQTSSVPSLFKPIPSFTFPIHFSSSPSFKSVLLSHSAMAFRNDKGKVVVAPLALSDDRLLPATNKVEWRGKCFKCLTKGHDRASCPAKLPKCAKCLREGHETRKCQADKFAADPLEPCGNLGESLLPTTRPDSISVYVPQTRDSYRDIRFLQRAVVVDARLWPTHNPSAVQAKLMATCKVNEPFELSPLFDEKYILILPFKLPRAEFLQNYKADLEKLALVVYPWNPRVGAEPIQYPFKVWLDLYKVPIVAWNLESLISMLS